MSTEAERAMTLVTIGVPVALFVVAFAVLYGRLARHPPAPPNVPSSRATILALVIVIAATAAVDLFVI